jgi:tRNA modification GTPase
VLGVIDARGAGEFQAALTQLAGGLAKPLTALREDLLDVLAELEAGLDFAEEDLQFISPEALEQSLSHAEEVTRNALAQLATRSSGLPAPIAVIVGPPNVGKSSLFNALAGADKALVSHLPGTTRDYLAVRLNLDGVEVELIDTAGVDPNLELPWPDRMAQQRTAQHQHSAAVRIVCCDAGQHTSVNLPDIAAVHTAEIRVVTKIDSAPHVSIPAGVVATSSRTGQGLAELRGRLRAAAIATSCGQTVIGTAARCGESLRLAQQHLQHARLLCRDLGQEELIAAEIRRALMELGSVVGTVYTDDVLDRVFSRFCIGK